MERKILLTKPEGHGLKDRVRELERQVGELRDVKEGMVILGKALDCSSDAIGIANSPENFTYVNRTFVELTGYDTKHLNEAGGPSFLYTDSGLAERVFDLVMRGGQWSGEIELLTRGKRIVTVEARVEGLKDEGGRIIGIIWVHNDISRRSMAEKALKESYETLVTVLNSLDVDVYVADMDTHEILFVSKHMQKSFGEDLVGKKCWKAFKQEKGPCEICNNDRLLGNDGQPSGVDVWEGVNALTGRWHINYDRAIKWVDGRFVRLEVAIDVTDLKRAEQALKERDASLRSVLATAPVGIGLTEDRILSWVSPELVNMVGYTEAELIGRSSRMLYVTDEEFERVGRVKYGEIDQKDMGEADTVWKCRDGRVIDIHLRSTVVDPDDLSKGVIFTALDTTFQKRLESQLQQAQKMEAIGTLAGGIAHDFNNILGAIMGYSEMALLDISQEGKVRYCVDQVLKASNRAKELIKQILAFSRQSAQEIRPVQITPIVKETLKMLRAFMPATIEIRQRWEAESAIVEADPTQIQQVFMNLCTNAQHAMRKKGGRLEVRLDAVDLSPDEAAGYAGIKAGPYLKLTVGDTGEGMDTETINRIFDPYYTTKKKGVGTGMGLAVVHGIVKEHGGTVSVQSEFGRGTTFDVFFPMADKPIETSADEFEPLPGGNEHILLVDDEKSLVGLVKEMLEKLGYRVSARSSSLEALEAFRAHPERFDLVITDMTMPNMTGETLAGELLHIRPSIPVILCTGYSERITEGKAKSMGIRELIMKPILMREMATTLRKVLDGAQ